MTTTDVTILTTKDQEEEEPQWWYFTFGSGHRLMPVNTNRPVFPGDKGIDLYGYYVKFHGTYSQARNAMVDKWGTVWAFQYSTESFEEQMASTDYTMQELIIK